MAAWIPANVWLWLAGICLIAGLVIAMLYDLLPCLRSRSANKDSPPRRWLVWLNVYGFLTAYALLAAAIVFAMIWFATGFFSLRA